jgi:hypothetical protein
MKTEKFKELAQKRVEKALKDVRLIGNLSNRGSYEYTDEQVGKIFDALHAELAKAKNRFSRSGVNGATEFRL